VHRGTGSQHCVVATFRSHSSCLSSFLGIFRAALPASSAAWCGSRLARGRSAGEVRLRRLPLGGEAVRALHGCLTQGAALSLGAERSIPPTVPFNLTNRSTAARRSDRRRLGPLDEPRRLVESAGLSGRSPLQLDHQRKIISAGRSKLIDRVACCEKRIPLPDGRRVRYGWCARTPGPTAGRPRRALIRRSRGLSEGQVYATNETVGNGP
jgi:hypothetical protein